MKAYNIPKTHNPEKGLTSILKKHSGRDSFGHVSVRHQGARQKRYYREIDFKRNKYNVEGQVESIEYDPNRNVFIALIKYTDGEKRYILQPNDLNIGDKVISGEVVDIVRGNALPLKNIPIGIEIHNIEIHPKQGGKMIRGAGTTATVVAKESPYVHIKLPSGEVKRFHEDCFATIGVLGNIPFKDRILGKAGRSRLMGIRPTVRGTAQNPRSHPHGGGEGRVGEGMHPKTPWGKPARGKRTRTKNKWSNKFVVISRHA
ncbi:50S ribosomal protein L2 [Candidatus Roizmanbacteria bacterium RIFOXYB2_FULL_38_10]|uniref:Large ribosomal subunit protein uL2 n=1 Tax=Candidatus Roizmanbacteria bacterium RIFOXYD1_FULL_38_12 TaxID=1802093 RepID=A0A1F7KZX0_9BACT|nr:MAG: 50S ribosomal protein L2 [Candidatus Roizmanbacteria bacterium RIFOXYA2_FULL_38_14]OGK63388.1 MAG: 50S ribosomal protein L2 [Candidatus Roizmanbacteria bacterium RIFOXYA1_FULL_37_12]OGK65234.1 MAG: 50S ribosomal protein L2 [Candidatus Roizmanbacteria bacterium RIFOXYB1_FULL_40_23]OGK68787.1 MAG: 50S ribosomal protein L2 [Candidatus Roizmanbacteria bacterium RIFOXYB2_FULL_38_10]OGK69639.1 MAG: 50S ribosomal protein L2 [Candidatus Roizmanbacteria bacterium RIFOXYC1_FULL_38_14]OGK72789.1 